MSTRPRLTPAMADTRRAVRELLRAEFPDALAAVTRMPGCVGGTGYLVAPDAPLVLVALSGGADSLALAAATAFEAQRCGLRAGAVVIDHRLQEGSALVAEAAATKARDLGLAPVVVRSLVEPLSPAEPPPMAEPVEAPSPVETSPAEPVEAQSPVETTTHKRAIHSHGPEADARVARYTALDEVARETGAQAILLAHTLNDQAETVLLGLTRGAGVTSLSGMPAVTRGVVEGLRQARPTEGGQPTLYLRPFLGITRAQTEQACADLGLDPWNDPHNQDARYTRVRIRHQIVPVLESELGPGVIEALARTASHLQDDAEVLDRLARAAWGECLSELGLVVDGIATHPRAVRTRVFRLAAERAGLHGLTAAHLDTIDHLVTDWHGQKALAVPGGSVLRTDGKLEFRAE